MEYTQNYQLPLWDKEDAVLRTDFNENNQKIDAALGALAAGHGNCKIEYGSYTGTGKYGRENACTLTFSGKPLFVYVQLKSYLDHCRFIQGANYGVYYSDSEDAIGAMYLDWSGNGISWYSLTSAEIQLNSNSDEYLYFALIAADE